MNFHRFAVALAAGIFLASCRGQLGNSLPSNPLPAQPQSVNPLLLQAQSARPGIQAPSIESIQHWVPKFTVIKPTDLDYDALQHGTSTTIPYYTGSIRSALNGLRTSSGGKK